MQRISFLTSLGVALCLTGWTAPVQAQEKTYTSMTPAQIEQILKGLNIDFKKSASKAEGVFLYDYAVKMSSVRLHFYNGRDLMLDVLFKEYPLETVNRWNTRAKFSRASVHKRDAAPLTALEANLDVLGGVTEKNVGHFIKTFHDEIVEFNRFLEGADPVPPLALGGSDKIFLNVTAEKLEGIMTDLKLPFKKTAANDMKSHFYDYESKNLKFRVYNFGGKDLMVDCLYKKIPLEAVNKYNFDKKFIRAVLYMPKEREEYTALEANLDCAAGISENMIRHFLLAFEGDAQVFLAFVNKN